MKVETMKFKTFLAAIMVVFFYGSSAFATSSMDWSTITLNGEITGIQRYLDDGDAISSELWTKAVLQVPGNPVTLVWKMVGADITPSGDQVISGYFYADPDDFAYGSVYNPIDIQHQSGSSFSGTATGTFNVDGMTAAEHIQLTGHIQPSGQISGSTTHTFLGTAGEGTFTGQLSGNTLTIENSGHDTAGDICSYTRHMSATRQ